MKSKKSKKSKSIILPKETEETPIQGMGLFPEEIPFTRNLGCASTSKPKKPNTDQ
ncbi:hypothetical protein [Algoriphagus sp. PAP.12]|uniref:hypothetical protein n=1 Tax=Algoriphagus sp. PAP.12 TaxID=2996678 RepID=UPI00227AE5DC|nr:hypothetical protein [Algoriphagus sp. PAP.12]